VEHTSAGQSTGRSATLANPVPMVQREIELRALLDAAWRHRRGGLVVIHTHQTDRHGEEIRN